MEFPTNVEGIEASMTSALSEPAASPSHQAAVSNRRRQGSCASAYAEAQTPHVLPADVSRASVGSIDPQAHGAAPQHQPPARGRLGGRDSTGSVVSLSRARSLRIGSLCSEKTSGDRSSAPDHGSASWPVAGLGAMLPRPNLKHHGSRRQSKDRDRARRPSQASSHRSRTSSPHDGERSTTHSMGSQMSFSLSSFRQDMVRSRPSKHMRRTSRAYTAGEGDSSTEPDAVANDAIGHVLRAEAKRMKMKATSKAYENDRRTVVVERELRHFHRSNSGKKQWKRSVMARAILPTFASTSGGRGEIEGHDAPSDHTYKFLGKVGLMKWGMTAVIAVVIALQAAAIIMGAYHLTHLKLEFIWRHAGGPTAGGRVVAYLLLVAYGLVGCFISAVLVIYVAPHAAGSGIPEIKACLNGLPQPQAFTFRTWISRSVGLLLVTSGGLFAGTEGPFAHLGAIVASAVAEGPTINGSPLWPPVLTGYRNRCDFVSQGAAMGVAAAFGAPIGGILFSLEEASTFWSKSVTWQAFLGALLAGAIAKLAKHGFTELPASGFIEFPDHDATFKLWEMGIFLLIGLGSGILGALFCQLVHWLLSFRRKFFKMGSPTVWSRRFRLMEVLLIVTISLGFCFWIPVLVGCTDVEHHAAEEAHHRRLSGGGDSDDPPDLSGGICHDDEYSTIAYILLKPKEAAIKALFTEKMEEGMKMEIPDLLISWCVIFFATILTFGTAIPVGLFIPNILAGACLGRAVGQAMLDWGYAIHPGIYALMGAAGGLAGFSRMTMSLAVICLEITNNMYLLLPLMLVIMSSKVVADQFNPSVYDIVLELNPEIRLLEDNLSEDHMIALDGLTAHDACTAEVAVLREVETVHQVCITLMRTQFGTFPVIDDEGRLVGCVARAQLTLLLARRQEKGSIEGDELIYMQDIADSSPEMTLWNTQLTRAFHHFRGLGLQHLCVVGETMILLGILTRTDFARLCQHGKEGVEQVDHLLHRKHAAISAGEAICGWPMRPNLSRRRSTTHNANSHVSFNTLDLGFDDDIEEEGAANDHVLVMSSAMRHPAASHAAEVAPVAGAHQTDTSPKDKEKQHQSHNGAVPSVMAAALAVARASSKPMIAVGSTGSPQERPPDSSSPSAEGGGRGGATGRGRRHENVCFEV